MGFNSLVLILNDAMDSIDRDPAAWWEKVKSMLMTPPPYRPRYGGDMDGTFGFGSSANGFQAVHNEHADTVGIYAVGGNCTTQLGLVSNSGRHSREVDQVQLLRELALRLGYDLRMKAGPVQVAVLQWTSGQALGILELAKDIRQFGGLKVQIIEQEWRDEKTGNRYGHDELLERGIAKAAETEARYVVYVRNPAYKVPKLEDERLVVRDLKTNQETEIGFHGIANYLRNMFRRIKHPFKAKA